MSAEPSIRSVGRYQILSELGRGAMGIVYKGHDPVIGRTVALKTILFRESDAENPLDLRQRLYREACAAGTLTHPNIVTIYDVIEESGMTAVAMEFVDGGTLKELIAEKAPLPLNQALDIFEQIAAALDYANQKKIVHRDIKPANIMIDPDRRVKVADFGLARTPTSSLTNKGAIMGTPSYMSPEQARGAALDGRSDMFSAAVVFYELVTKEKPFKGRTLVETLDMIVNRDPTPASHYNGKLTKGVLTVFERAFKKNPDERYKSGSALVSALRQATGIQHESSIDLDAKTVLMNEKTIAVNAPAAAAAMADARTVRMPPPAAPEPEPRPARAAAHADVDPVLRAEPPPPAAASQRGLPIAIVAAAVILAIGGLLIARSMRSNAPPPSSTQGSTAGAPPPVTTTVPPPATTTQPPVAPPIASGPPVTVPAAGTKAPGGARGRGAAGTPARGASPDADPPARPASTATLLVNYDGPPYALTLLADGRQIGHVSDGQATVTVDAGRVRLRAVNEQLFVDQDFGSLTIGAGERRVLPVPATATVFVGVKGDNYNGLRILLDGRALPGPYPAQLPRVGASSHKIQFRWSEGALSGQDVTETIDLAGGRQFIIRALPDEGRVTVQKLR